MAIVFIATMACGKDDRPRAASDGDGYRISELPFAGEFANASEYQKDIVEDGLLTFQEYEAAIASTVGCLRDSGFIVADDAMQINARKQYTYSATYPDGDDEPYRRAAIECTETYSIHIAGAWEWFTRPTESEIAAGRAALAACLVEADVEVSSDPTSQEFAQLAASGNQDYQRCIIEVQEAYALPNFGG